MSVLLELLQLLFKFSILEKTRALFTMSEEMMMS